MTTEAFAKLSQDDKINTMRAALAILEQEQKIYAHQNQLQKMLEQSKAKCELIRNNPNKKRLLTLGIVLIVIGIFFTPIFLVAIAELVARFMWIRKNQPEWDALADRTYKNDYHQLNQSYTKDQEELKRITPYIQTVHAIVPPEYCNVAGVQGILNQFMRGADSMYMAVQGYEIVLDRERTIRHEQKMEEEAARQTEVARQNLAANTVTAGNTKETVSQLKGIRGTLHDIKNNTSRAANAAESAANSSARAARASERNASAAERSANASERNAAASERSARASEWAAESAYDTATMIDNYLS